MPFFMCSEEPCTGSEPFPIVHVFKHLPLAHRKPRRCRPDVPANLFHQVNWNGHIRIANKNEVTLCLPNGTVEYLRAVKLLYSGTPHQFALPGLPKPSFEFDGIITACIGNAQSNGTCILRFLQTADQPFQVIGSVLYPNTNPNLFVAFFAEKNTEYAFNVGP